ncbi:MAG: hypothetical protein EPO39_05105 [Candidatus Manganitrophaceae bacterium]|nr:MAG: hypothetical protein EPO39_05105 [Candidatus Manganitrophaceae bacterium]
MRRSLFRLIATAVFFCSLSKSGWSFEVTDRLRIDAFGTQGYLKTSSNTFLGTDHRGTFDFSAYNLLFKANPADRFQVWIELASSSQLKDEIMLEWAFGEYVVSDRLHLKFGKMALPIGIYNEMRDVYPILPLTVLPAFYTEATEFSPATFKGVGLSGQAAVGLPVEYDLFGGTSFFNHSTHTRRYENVVGGRLWLNTPHRTFRFGQTLFTGTEVVPKSTTTAEQLVRMSTYIPSIEYFSPIGLNLRGELALHYHQGELENPKDPRRLGYYLEATYLIKDRFMPVVRYDVYYPRRRDVKAAKDYQTDITVGFNYNLTDFLVWKADAHFIRGTALLVAADNPTPQTRWQLYATSLSFLF